MYISFPLMCLKSLLFCFFLHNLPVDKTTVYLYLLIKLMLTIFKRHLEIIGYRKQLFHGSEYRIPGHYCLLEAASFKPRGIKQ